MSRPDSTFFDVFVDQAARGQDRPAIVASGSDPLSYKDLAAQIGRIWDTLREAGVGYGSKVAIALPSGTESVISTVAIASHATCVPVNPHLSQSEFERELTRFSLDALIVPAWRDSAVRAAAEQGSYGLFEASNVSGPLSRFGLRCVRPAKATRKRSADISSQSAILLLRTSATTGPSKLVPVTHGNMIDLAGKMAGWFGLTSEDRAACVLPTYYAAGSKLNVLVPLLLGESIAVPVAVSPERLAEWIGELRPTWFSAGPTFLQAVLDDLRSGREPPPEHLLRFITAGSAHLPGRIRTDLEAILGCPILEVYGISEAGVMAANPAPPAKRKPGTAGLIPAGELVIRGETGLALPPGEIGEIFVGGPGLMPGYVGGSEPVGAGLQDGWLHTGDIGSVDSDGFLTVVGRTKEVINRGGEKISPNDVEQALLLHPCVREAVAFSVPHPRLGENVASAVVLQPEATTTPVELRTFLRERLAAFKIPQRIDIVASLPKSDHGKVLRARLADANVNRETQIDLAETPLEFQILDIWQRLLQRTDIGVYDDFFEAGGDSLLATQMLLEVESAMGHCISQADLAEASTIRQLAMVAAADVNGRDELVTKAKEGTGTPFFFCHGDICTRGFYALKLAALLDADQPIYMVQPPRDVDATTELVIEDMARQYVPRLLTLQPHGKFRLGGFCNGGLLAWEIAHQIRQTGREVESVVLIDTLSLNSRRLFRAIRRLLDGMTAVTRTEVWRRRLRREAMPMVWNSARKFNQNRPLWIVQTVQSLYRRVVSRKNVVNPLFDRWRDEPYLYLRAMANYFPPKLDCEIISIACEHNANIFEWSAEPWTRLARDVHQFVVPGSHLTCITTHVEVLAQSLNAARACIATRDRDRPGEMDNLKSIITYGEGS